MAENLQEYYKRMAEAIDTQLEQKGKAALFYPVGSGSGRIVWAWINAHPDAAVIWVVPRGDPARDAAGRSQTDRPGDPAAGAADPL